MIRQIPSSLLEGAVEELAKLPGIGERTAMRLALFLLKQDDDFVNDFTGAINRMKKEVRYCKICNNISDSEVCSVCSDRNRDASIICVVENIKDVMAIEATMQYNGVYHVLGGLVSPMDGIGPTWKAIPRISIFTGNCQDMISRLQHWQEVFLLVMNLNIQTRLLWDAVC